MARLTSAQSLDDNMRHSAQAMQRSVWPRWCGYIPGKLEPVELNGKGGVGALLDTGTAIDYFYVRGPGLFAGVASRVEWREPPISNFTIRYKLRSGQETEFQKLDSALSGGLAGAFCPQAHIHSFVVGSRGRCELATSAIARSADIVAFLKKGLYEEGEAWLRAHLRTNPDDGVQFLVAGYKELVREGYPMAVLKPDRSGQVALFDSYQELKEYNGGLSAIWSRKQ